jgi:hypothetical protein
VAAAAAGAQPAARLAIPTAADLARAAAFPESTLATAATVPADAFGGRYTAPDGESVAVFSSRRYAPDAAANQRWADFLASLIHGPELASVTVYLAPSAEISRLCGGDALACYQPTGALITVPGQDPAVDLSAEAVLTHEYGHHVAANRLNPPWRALDWGTKRWASYEEVCALAKTGSLYPGAENSVQYALNPGEGFAESYRVLNERRAGLAEPPWNVVDESLIPNDAALALLERDVVDPWTQPTTQSFAGTFRRTGAPRRTYGVSTPFDGALQVTLRAPAGARLALDVLSPNGARLGRAVTTASVRTRTVGANVCGQRSVQLRVARIEGRGAFGLDVSKP